MSALFHGTISDLFTGRFITVRVIVPAQTLFFQAYKVSQVAQGLLDVLAQHNILHNPIIFHVFSNGGCMVYTQLTALLNSPDCEYHDKVSVRGVIFDSSPGKRRILNAVKAFMSTLQLSLALRYLLGFCLLMYLIFTRILLRLLPMDLGSGRGFQLYEALCKDPAQCPQLFLYSRADQVILAKDVEEVMAKREEKGVPVKSVCWEDSQHVAHMRAHPEVYTKACLDFVTTCITPHASKL